MVVRVQSEQFDAGSELTTFTSQCSSNGAVVSFTGIVRADEISDSNSVLAMTLEHYPGMTETMLARAEMEAHERWNLENILIIHRYGRMEPTQGIVFVATASAHRADAFAACNFLMDWLKTNAPFWKYEETDKGGRWVGQKDKDVAAAKAWEC